MSSLKGFNVLVTGAGSPPGSEVALGLAARDANIAAVDVSPLPLETIQREIEKLGGVCRTYLSDMAKKRFVQGALESVRDDSPLIHGLVLANYVDPRASLLTMDDWDWQRALDVNLSGAFYTLQSYARITQEQPQGGAAVLCLPGERGALLNICAAALQRLAAEAARAYAPQGLRVSAIQGENLHEAHMLDQLADLLVRPDVSGALF